MSSTNTEISICSKALVLIGGDEINSFSDASREAKVCGELYPLILEDQLTRHPWVFSQVMTTLTRLEDEPLFDYDYAYLLPSNMMQFSRIEHAAAYEIYENKLYTNLSEVNAVYQIKPQEHYFPPYFVRLLVYDLAGDFSMALQEDKDKMQLYKKLALDYEKIARFLDSKKKPSRGPRPQNFSLIEVRR